MKIDGGCQCGFITYEADADPEQVSVCHCTDCQKFSGGAFRVGIVAPEESFRLLSGSLKIYVKTAESGGKREQVFCPECGTHIYSTSVGGAARQFRIRVPTTRQCNELVPKRQGWMRSAQRWLGDLADIPGSETAWPR
jgi:hypothetical protein